MQQPRNASLIRVLTMLHALLDTPQTVTQLADTFGVSKRTVFRDFDVLDAVGYAVLKHQTGNEEALYRVRTKRRKSR